MTSRTRGSESLARWAPGLHSLLNYQRGWLRGDLVAGLAVSAYLIPQVMAYAELAGLPAIRGLWAIVGPLCVYAIVGSSRRISVGPESTTALMTATAVAALTVGRPEAWAAVATALALATGVICIVGRLLRLGFLAELLSKPVLTGYMLGIAVLMILSQLGKVTGLKIPHGNPLSEIWYVLTHTREINVATLLLSTTVVAGLLACRKWVPKLPSTLIVMVLAAVAVAVFGLGAHGVKVVGDIPRGLPLPAAPDLAGIDLVALALAALGISVVAFSDNVLTARAFADSDEERVDGGQELLALGAANVAASFFHGFPVSSSGSRTAIAAQSGARSQLYSLVAALTVIAALLVLGPLLALFPLAALGGVVVYAATRLVDIPTMRKLARFRISEFLIACVTAIAVLAVDVLYGIVIAIALSILDLLRRIAKPHDGVLGYIPGLAGMHDVADYPESTQVAGLLVYRYDSPLFFANSSDFVERAVRSVDEAAAKSGAPIRWFLLNAEANIEIDWTAVEALEALVEELRERDVVIAVARVKFEVFQAMAKAGLVDKIGRDYFFQTLPSAVQAYRDWAVDRSDAGG